MDGGAGKRRKPEVHRAPFHPAVPVEVSDRDRFLEENLSSVPQAVRPGPRRSLEALPPTGAPPAVQGMELDSDLDIWPQDYPAASDIPDSWAAFDPSSEGGSATLGKGGPGGQVLKIWCPGRRRFSSRR